MSPARLCWISLALMALLLPSPGIAWDPEDPYHDRFLHRLLRVLVEARSGDKASLAVAKGELQNDLTTCSDKLRNALAEAVIHYFATTDWEHLDDAIHLLRGTARLVERHWKEGEQEIEAITSGALEDKWLAPLAQEIGRYLFESYRHQALVVMAEALKSKAAVADSLPGELERNFLLGSYFRLGRLQEYLDSGYEVVSGWRITALRRLGHKTEARRELERDMEAGTNNPTSLVFAKTPAERERICGQWLSTDQGTPRLTQEIEASADDLSNWWFLLCGRFEDAIRLNRRWEWRDGKCSDKRYPGDINGHSNAALAHAYLAAKGRRQGNPAATRRLGQAVAETRKWLYIDQLAGRSLVHGITDDDIPMYMVPLHGWNPEIRVILGLLEQARGNPQAARDAWRRALQDQPPLEPPLDQAWQDRLADWIEALGTAGD
ncbi:hypothetical protein [Candidatus Thiosymbion oneisti]|uniref:hypothetical protein n=1 Tax=Candidatus Thiosymbion oneisti TaxID=589554 RepID=UPI00105E243B|nr:hypothetical protein [Candidatus Thiosymbion oneisti]